MAVSVIFKFAASILCGLLLCSGLLADFFRLRRENRRLQEGIFLQKERMQKEKQESL